MFCPFVNVRQFRGGDVVIAGDYGQSLQFIQILISFYGRKSTVGEGQSIVQMVGINLRVEVTNEELDVTFRNYDSIR